MVSILGHKFMQNAILAGALGGAGCGVIVVTMHLSFIGVAIGGLLIFNLILNPAAAAYQLTYNQRRMFLLPAVFGIFSTWLGLLGSYLFHFPSGVTIVLVSTMIFITAAAFSPKRRVRQASTG